MTLSSEPPLTDCPRPRFTRDGSDELEAHLNQTCECVLQSVRRIIPARQLEALMLGGGYGRGEGGVLRTATGDQPYNDLEFYLCLRGNRLLNQRRYQLVLHHLAKELEPGAGVEVEFKIISLAYLRGAPASMFYYDLVMGHRWLWGDETLLHGCDHHRQAHKLPMAEATRLLLNRCTGLLLAREKLDHSNLDPPDLDFVGRNLAKAQLAFGDAVLVSFGQYHWSCAQRHGRLLTLLGVDPIPWLEQVQEHHASGVKFKLHPVRTSVGPGLLRTQHDELTGLGLQLWLWLENRRLNCSFQSAREYALSAINKCPETKRWRNLLLNLSAFGLSICRDPKATRAPRERLFNALTLLLWEKENEPETRLHLQRHLGLPKITDPNLIESYQTLWHRFQ